MISRQDALEQGLARYFTGKPCKYGHTVERYTNNKTCCECANAAANKVKAKNPDKYYETNKAWRQNNPEKSSLYTKKYVRRNLGKRNLWTSNYRQAKDKRIPKWLNQAHLFEIECVYNYCTALRQIGLDYHVDHIVPLRGEIVSGMHVPWNLQVIPKLKNLEKGNRYAI